MEGKYFVKQRIAQCTEAARDGQAAARLWRWSEEMVGF
jgi:hypothetical protein